jgi:hypothetical protein
MALLVPRNIARRQIPRWLLAAAVFAALICIGCGGGSAPPTPTPPPTPSPGTPLGTYTIIVTATSSNPSVPPVSIPVTLIVR